MALKVSGKISLLVSGAENVLVNFGVEILFKD